MLVCRPLTSGDPEEVMPLGELSEVMTDRHCSMEEKLSFFQNPRK